MDINLHFTGEWTFWMGLVIALGLALLTWLLYRREVKPRGGRLAWLLPGLRTLAVFLLAMMLTGPVLHHRKRIGQLARVILLVDASESMTLTDEHLEPSRKLLFARSVGWLRESAVDPRLSRAANALAEAQRRIALAGRRKPLGNIPHEVAQAVARDMETAFDELKKMDASAGFPAVGQQGAILRELWSGIPGSNVGDLTRHPNFPDKPSERTFPNVLESPANTGDNFGVRLRGFLHPTATGSYLFWISADKSAELWLSPDFDPARKILIAKCPAPVEPRQYEKFAEQKSSPIRLVAGQKYAMEVLHKESTGSDHVSVGWQLPDGSQQRPIPGACLSPIIPPSPLTRDLLNGLLSRFTNEMVNPAKQFTQRKKEEAPAKLMADLNVFAGNAAKWEQELLGLFTEYGRRITAAGEGEIRAALEKFDAAPRLRRAETFLLSGKEKLLAQIAVKHEAELHALLGGETRRIWRSRSGKKPETLPLESSGKSTNLSDPLAAVVGEQEAEKMAVVLVSDGQHNEGSPPLHTAKILGNRGIPVFTVAMGGGVPLDLAIVEVKNPEMVFVEDRVKGEITLKDDMPAGQPFTLRIQHNDQTVWEKNLVTDRTHLRKIEYDFPVKDLVEKMKPRQGADVEVFNQPLFFKVSVPPLAGEKKTDNNQGTIRVRAILQKQKILVIDSRPRWEFRYIRNLFERDAQWDVNALLLPADGTLKRGAGPVMFPADRETLFSYDLIVLGEIPRKLFRPEEFQWLSDFVGNCGGGLVLVDGRRGEWPLFKGTPIETLLPVDVKSVQGKPAASPPVRLQLTERGATVPPLELVSGSTDNAALWQLLPAMHWIASVTAKPGSEIFLEAMVGQTRLPALVFRRFGAGKVLYAGFDESWRWRYEVADRYHARYWNQLGKWMMEPPFAVRDRFVSLDAGSLTLRPGDSAGIRIRLRDEHGRPITSGNPQAVFYRGGSRIATVSLVTDENESGIFRGKSGALPEGHYEVAIEASGYPERERKARAEFEVQPPDSRELTELSANEEFLRQVAQISGGAFFREEDAARVATLLKPLSQGKVVENEIVLWQSWWWFAPIILLFTLEWILRKRAGLL
ncbi:MAG: hypothetical protein HY360_18670 [Verrucomicrobia bacterium]|nr:hypothetical protein [Verrucomicrobiota bacterium]